MRSSRRCSPHCQNPETRACTTSATTRLSSPGLTGRSSTPQLLGWTRPSLEYWVARSSRAMTAVFVRTARRCRFSDSNFKQQIHVGVLAAGGARGLRFVVPQTGGSRECRMRAAPAVPCAKGGKENRTRAYRAAEAIRHSLRNGFTAYIALFPEYRAFLPPSPYGNRHSGPVGLARLRKT